MKRDLSFSQGLGIFTILSLICGLALAGASVWLLQLSVEAYSSPKAGTPFDLVTQFNLLFSGAEPLYNHGELSGIYRILIANSVVIFVASLLQCGINAYILASKRNSKVLSSMWISSHIFLLLVIFFPSLCLAYNELTTTSLSVVFLMGVSIFDLVFLLISISTLIRHHFWNSSHSLVLQETSL